MHCGEGQAAACRIAHEGDAPMVEPISKPAVCRDRILDCSRKRVFGSEPVIEIEHAGARRDSDTPQEVAVKRGGADHITAAMEIEEVTIAVRLGNGDVNGPDPIGIDHLRSCARGREGNNALDQLQSPAYRGNWHGLARLALLEIAQA